MITEKCPDCPLTETWQGRAACKEKKKKTPNKFYIQTLLHSHNLTFLSLTPGWSCCSHTSSTPLMRSNLRGEEGAHRYQTSPTKPQKPSTSAGSDPAFLSQSEQEIESVHWKLSWHFPPLLLPLSSWVRLPRELLWWLIDFNHITRLQKSRQRMKVLGKYNPFKPTHTHISIFIHAAMHTIPCS